MTSKKVYKEGKFEFNEAKFKELILYIADRCSDDTDFGAVKLNKILFYSDFFAYGKTGKPITGATYFKLPLGPAPKQLVPMREKMKKDSEIAVYLKRYFSYQQERIIPLREANLDNFSAEEISIVEQVINLFHGVNGAEISSKSHMELGYQIANEQGEIPYEAAFLSNLPVSDYEIEHGLELAKNYGWTI